MPSNEVSKKKKENSFQISDAGNLGRDIYNSLVTGIELLTPVSGRIYVEVNLEIQDENVFKDDELRSSKLIIEIQLDKKED